MFKSFDPLETMGRPDSPQNMSRRAVEGILDSYNGNYDILAEALQNAVDAIEDQALRDRDGSPKVEVTIDLGENAMTVVDNGTGMDEICFRQAFAPHVSFKDPGNRQKIGDKDLPYRGFKGVGLTFLAYGNDEIRFHTRQDGHDPLRGVMRNGLAWARGEVSDPPKVTEDIERPEFPESVAHGTYVRIQLGSKTRPKSLAHLVTEFQAWETILRTRTAIGVVPHPDGARIRFEVHLRVIQSDGKTHRGPIEPSYLAPDQVVDLRTLDLNKYYTDHAESSEPPRTFKRQDAVWVEWDQRRIKQELLDADKSRFNELILLHPPAVYGFLPYQGSLWPSMNQKMTGRARGRHLAPGLVLAADGMTVGDTLEIKASRFEMLSRNMLVRVHFRGVRPDQGRKTVQDDITELAQRIADRMVQYLAKQRAFLKPPGDMRTPQDREIERGHGEWVFNVQTHARNNPLTIESVPLVSEPQAEQDVVALFNELASLGMFPGLRIYATSQIRTYDSLVEFDALSEARFLRFDSKESPFGLTDYHLTNLSDNRFKTKVLTLEYKNNLDGLVDDVGAGEKKQFRHIDIVVAWTTSTFDFPGFTVDLIEEENADDRSYPGVTHILRKDGEGHQIQVILLKDLVLKASALKLI